MEKDLEKYLKVLNSERCLKKPKDAGVMIDKIYDCFNQENSNFTLSLLVGFLLDETKSIFTFIWKSSLNVETLPSVTAAFSLLEYLVDHFQNCVEPYFPVLFEKCIYLIDRKLAKVKQLSLKLIKKLVAADSKQRLDLPKLVTELERHLRDDSKMSGMVSEQIFEVLGYLFEKHPETVSNKEWFFEQICESLRNDCTVTKNPSVSRMKGAFEGINGYLSSYSTLRAEKLKEIYEHIKKLSKFQPDKRATSRVGLKILQNHWSHFSNFIYEDREFWRINMEVWSKQKKEDRVAAFQFLCSFYSVIALVAKVNSAMSEVSSYVEEFANSLNSECSAYEKRAALVGIKLFVLTDSMERSDFNRIYEVLMHFIKKHEAFTSFVYFPLCIECLSAFVFKRSIENVSVEQLAYLQRLSVRLIDTYPSFEPELQPDVVVALEKSFYNLGLNSLEVVESHIGKVVYQGLIRTCSSVTAAELEVMREMGTAPDSITYKSYLGLWKYLLTLASSCNLPVSGSSLKKGVASRVFDSFVESFLRIISKLNLRVGADMEAEKPSDVYIFINMIDLYQDLVPVIDSFHLQKWLIEILKSVINLSRKNPLVSGFYKILSASLQFAESSEFFEEDTQEKQKNVELLRVFVEEILPRVDQYKGELQLSCLKLILSAPVRIIESFVEKIIPALEVAIHLSRSCFPLLRDLIETLERWDLYLSPSTSSAIMAKVLPHFDKFFQSPYFSGNSLVDTSIEGKKLKRNVVFSDSELLSVQKRFLMFLGHLEISKATNLIELRDTEESCLGDQNLVYQIPFSGRNVEINFNEIMPRVIDLATSCIDRKARITACELLYSGVMLLLGNVKQLSGGYTALFRKCMRTCLALGCDSDGVVCQIFEPLMYQVVRYFSGKEALNFSESTELLNVLMDHVTRPYNPTLRDFTAQLIKEFTAWSLKQLTPEELKATPRSVSRILKNIYSLTLHPSFSKRLGAAVVFNRIYAVLREEEFILNAYWFQLFYHFMESLRMCEGPEDVTEILEAIQHVKRPLVEKYDHFNEDCPEREVPPEFEGGRLCHLVKWTMERACDVKASTRQNAMAVVQELAPLVENCDSTMSFVNKQFRNFFHSPQNSFQSEGKADDFIVWLNYQIAGFEYCTWLLDQKVLSAEEVLQPQFTSVLKSYILTVTSLSDSYGAVVEVPQQESVIKFLELLFALKERVCLYPPELWDLLKKVLFRPTSLGFNFDQTGIERLSSVLTELLRHFSSHLTSYDWEAFYQDLDTLVSVPSFSTLASSQQIDGKCLEFLFAFRVIEASGLWPSFREKMFFPTSEYLFIVPIFRSLFYTQGKVVFARSLEPSCRLYLEEMMGIMLRVTVDLKGVFGCLENEEEVQEEETNKVMRKGEFFQLIFKNVIFSFLEKNHDPLLERILQQGTASGLRLLIQIVESNSEGSDLPVAILQRWHDFDWLKTEGSLAKSKDLLQLIISCAKAIGTPGFLKASLISEEIYAVLGEPEFQETDEFEGVIGLLGFLSDFGEIENHKLSACLSKYLVDQSALKECVAKGGSELRTVKFTVKGVLQGLKATGSLVLLRFALSRAGWFEAVSKEEDVHSALTAFADPVPLRHSLSALKLAYSFCFSQKRSQSALVVNKLFLKPLLGILPNAAVYDLVNENLEDLCKVLTELWGGNASLREMKANLIEKTCAAELFQIFVTKLSKPELDEMPRERKQLIDAVVKRAFFLLRQPSPPKALEERHRKLMCEIFNMICCIVSARCKEEKFYKLFIFDERGSFLFAAIDKSSAYSFDMDFEEIPKRKKLLTLLRETVSKGGRAQQSVKYIQTNTLFTSSLREDVTRFDLTHSAIRPMDSLPQETPRNVEIELEMDSLNSHECMPVLVATISKMVRDKITPGDDVTELPCWLKFFLNVLSNPALCENLKLFVLKALYNVQDFVAPYCRQVFPPMLDSVLKLFENRPLSYLLVDLIEIMIGWVHIPEGEKPRWQLTELLLMVLRKGDSFKRDITKHNLEVLKAMVEAWKSALHFQELSSVVFKRLFESVEADVKAGANGDGATYFNAHACGVLLSNGIPAWKKGAESQFFQLVLKNFREENRHNELFGEICGLALSHLEKNDPNALEQFEEMVRDKIHSLPTIWLPALYGVHKHHPGMSSRFTMRIFSSAWDSTDCLLSQKLEMLLSHVTRAQAPEEPTFERHAHAFLLDMLSSPDVVVQELSLQIAEKLLEKIEDDKLSLIMKEAVRLQRSVHAGVRKWVYDIGRKLYHKSSELTKMCRVVMLRGLNDDVEELEKSCLRFWEELLDLSSLDATLLQVLQLMYTPETEDIFLSNAAKVLLKFAVDDVQLEKSVFVHPITHQCRFQKRNLIITSRSSAFRSTLSRTLTNESIEHVNTLRRENLPYLRPTVGSLMFEPTVQAGSEEGTRSPSTSEEVSNPSNPFKRRFYKSEEKSNFSFVSWQRRKKKKEAEEEEEMERKRETALSIFGEYRDGDFPDIQLRHSQILKLLEALARKDRHFSRQFLFSLYSGWIELAKASGKTALLSDTGKCFDEMLASSGSFDPGVFGFVLQLVLKLVRHLDIDCQLISNAAVSSNWLSLGALIIEDIIAHKRDVMESRAKRRKGCGTSEEMRWLELAKLYRGLEEWDVLSGIFRDKLGVQSEAREAMHCEALLNWLEASKHYEAALQADPESGRSEFYTEAYFSCLARLSNWSLLNTCIRSTVENDLEELWKNYNLLSWFLKSEVMISLEGGQTEFRGTLEEFCRNAGKKSVLGTNFGEELAAFDLLSDKFQRANYWIDRVCLDFLAGWSHLDEWSYNLRAAKLANLQTLSELGFAVTNLAKVSREELERNIKLAARRWEKNLPTATDDLTVWDVKLRYRRQFLKHMREFDLTTVEVKAYLALAKAALDQKNLNLAKEYLSRAKDILPEGDETLRAEHDNCFNLGKMVVARLKMADVNLGLEMYLNIWKSVSKELSSAMETDRQADKSQLYSSSFTLGQLVAEVLPPVQQQSASQPVLESIRAMLNVPEKTNLPTALRSSGLEYLETAKAALEGMECSSDVKASCYLELTKFLLKFPNPGDLPELEKLYTYTFRSMELGSPEARQLFGCLLSVSGGVGGPSPFEEIIRECNRVPSWMFLMWINQMLACLNSKVFAVLKSILLRIARDYPNAIRYPLKLAEEGKTADGKTKSFFIKLNEILCKERLYEEFWTSMKFLAPPDLILRHHVEDALQEVSQQSPDYPRVSQALHKLQEMMFSADFNKFRGPIFKFWENFNEPLKDLLASFEDKEALVTKLKGFLSSIKTSRPPSAKALQSYSPWLHSFHSLNTDTPLELPGQYAGDRRPVPKYLLTVTSFSNSVLPIDSKCRPLRITLLGNDATEHKFLIKFGEDLRQDERIQQLFRHFCSRLTDSRQTKRLSLDTYKVVPLTHALGMIQWVDSTVSLSEMIENSLDNGKDALARAQAAHLAFLAQNSPPPDSPVPAHLNAYDKIKRQATISNFRLRVQDFPKALLKKSFLDLSTSPQHFVHLRSNFATSHAVMCITHWLVGIGDRHLQNTLVSTTTGRVLGIDFGYAFGFATQFLTPPELLPFRLSPQILAFLHPLDDSGWIKQTMVHCLRLFRKDRFHLLSLLEVFAQEPLMDWLKQARKSPRCESESPEYWYPREKLSLVDRKLTGANPVSAFEADLRAGHSESKYLARYLEVLRGVPSDNIRARCQADGLTEEEQVECLIDLATDPHVLGKTYIGWNPWV